jgi:hypothetical protein
MTSILARIIPLMLLVGAVAGPQTVPHPGGGPALIIPAGSPVQFRGFDKEAVARFDGQFLLSGTFTLNCDMCEPPATEDDVDLYVVPDQQLARRMPHWQGRGDRMAIEISNIERLKHSIASSRQLAGLASGKIRELRGRISIVADHYVADFGCDYSPYYAARFVKLPRPAKLAQVKVDGDFGCA